MPPGGGPEQLTSECLDSSRHLLQGFDCGEPELDEWLVKYAEHAASMHTARTFVWLSPGDPTVVAYYALCAFLVRREETPRRIGKGSPEAIPAILIAKLALSARLQGQGLGAELLWDGLERCWRSSQTAAAARLVVVDALHPKASAFYSKYGFAALPDHPLRLFQKMSDIASALSSGT